MKQPVALNQVFRRSGKRGELSAHQQEKERKMNQKTAGAISVLASKSPKPEGGTVKTQKVQCQWSIETLTRRRR